MSARIPRIVVAGIAACVAAGAFAAPPLAGSWSIAPTGSAASSGELLFRVTPGDGDPVEVTVNVRSGSNDVSIARDIRQALSAQLRRDRYNVQLGEGANVLVSDQRGRPNFSVELIDSDIDNLRVAVRNIEPAASPTVPAQAAPANTQPPGTPPQPGAATPPAQNPGDVVPANPPPPDQTPPQTAPNTPSGGNSSPAAPPPTNNAPVTAPNAPVPNPTPNGSPNAPPPNASAGGAPASAPPPR